MKFKLTDSLIGRREIFFSVRLPGISPNVFTTFQQFNAINRTKCTRNVRTHMYVVLRNRRLLGSTRKAVEPASELGSSLEALFIGRNSYILARKDVLVNYVRYISL